MDRPSESCGSGGRQGRLSSQSACADAVMARTGAGLVGVASPGPGGLWEEVTLPPSPGGWEGRGGEDAPRERAQQGQGPRVRGRVLQRAGRFRRRAGRCLVRSGLAAPPCTFPGARACAAAGPCDPVMASCRAQRVRGRPSGASEWNREPVSVVPALVGRRQEPEGELW